jgi:hypothetical protein
MKFFEVDECYDHDASLAAGCFTIAGVRIGNCDGYYDDDEPTLEAEAVNPLQNRCDFIEWQARLYWLDEPQVQSFIQEKAEGRGRDEEDRIAAIMWSRDELGLKTECFARAERAWANTK